MDKSINKWIDATHLKHSFNWNHFKLYPNLIQDPSNLVDLCNLKLHRLAREYMDTHFDSVIHGYKECSVSSWPKQTYPFQLFNSIKSDLGLSSSEKNWCYPHILDLKDLQSGIKAHVDNIQASGSIIMGLCLLSPAVMVFRHVKDPSSYFTVLLPENCGYVQMDSLRYEYTHEIPSGSDHVFNGKFIHRGRRLCILLRDCIEES